MRLVALIFLSVWGGLIGLVFAYAMAAGVMPWTAWRRSHQTRRTRKATVRTRFYRGY